jgi:hypothetical protein
VNGVASSQVKLKTAEAEAKQRQADEAKAKKNASKNPWQPAAEATAEVAAVPASEAADPDKPEKKKARKETEAEKKAREKKEKEAQEQFCIDPTKMALFHRTAPAGATAGPEASGSPEDDAHGLWLRYVKVSTSCWSEQEIRRQMDDLRAPDEEREVVREAVRSQAQQLVLDSLHQSTVPIWGHPAFASEFGDVRASTSNRAGPAHR